MCSATKKLQRQIFILLSNRPAPSLKIFLQLEIMPAIVWAYISNIYHVRQLLTSECESIILFTMQLFWKSLSP